MTKITKAKFIKAADKSGGILQVMADRLNVDRSTIYLYINKHEWAKKKLNDAREQLVDLAESKLINKLQDGEAWATQFTLKTLGKHRGYVERQEVSTTGNLSININKEEIRESIDNLLKKK